MEKKAERLHTLITGLALAAAMFALFRCFPLTGDDWFREGLGASLHSIGELARVVADKWRTTNGRILGNILAYSAGSRPLLRELLRAGIMTALVLLLARCTGLRETAGAALCAALTLALPREMFREVYPWAAGFFNYVPPAALLLASIALLPEVFEDRALNAGAGRCAALFTLNFSTQLFVENVTLCTLCTAAALNLWYLLRRRRTAPALLCCLAGAAAGAALLFASPSYLAAFADGGSYQTGAAGGLAGLLSSARENCGTVFRFLLAGCPVLYGSITALLGARLARSRRAADRALLLLMLLCAAALGVCTAFPARVDSRAAMVLCLAWFLLAGLAVLRRTEGALRARLLFYFFAALCAALPLLFVSPVGPRCLYAGYVFLLAAAGCLLAESGMKMKCAGPVCAGLCAAVMVFYASTYLPLRRTVARQESLIREAMARGERTVRVPACGGSPWLWEPDSPKMEHAYFYFGPGDLHIEFVSAEERTE